MNPMREGIARAARGRQQVAEDGSCSQEFCFDPDFVGFSGHFPGYPILPGVVQLLLAQCLVEAAVGRGLELQEVSNAKFLEQLAPGGLIRVSCTSKGPERAGWWAARLEIEGRLAASFQLLLAAKED